MQLMWPSTSAISMAPKSISSQTPTPRGVGISNLIKRVQETIGLDEDFFFLRFESLQRTNIVALEVQLLHIQDKIRSTEAISNEELEKLRETFGQHSKQRASMQWPTRTSDGTKLQLPPK